MSEPFKIETENLYRGLPGAVTLRDGEGDMGEGEPVGGETAALDSTIVGHFCRFNEWTEIESWYEGTFLERVAFGAFTKTIRENLAQVKVQFDHGEDDWVGSAPLGPIDVIREEAVGVWFEVPLLDTDYNRERLLPQLQGRLMTGERRGSLLGASFRFRVVKDVWDFDPGISEWNPKGLPERTITEVRLFEFGPVVFPAYPTATAGAATGARSLTDHYLERRRSKRSATPHLQAAASGTAGNPGNEPQQHSSADNTHNSPARRSARLAVAFADLS